MGFTLSDRNYLEKYNNFSILLVLVYIYDNVSFKAIFFAICPLKRKIKGHCNQSIHLLQPCALSRVAEPGCDSPDPDPTLQETGDIIHGYFMGI